jgi:hypothetical protein
MRGGGCRVTGNEYSCECAYHVTWSPNKLWRSTSIFNLWLAHTSSFIRDKKDSVRGKEGAGGRGRGLNPRRRQPRKWGTFPIFYQNKLFVVNLFNISVGLSNHSVLKIELIIVGVTSYFYPLSSVIAKQAANLKYLHKYLQK